MQKSGLQIIAPGLLEQTWTEAEVLGGAIWLWMHSARHRMIPLQALPTLLLPAIKNSQFLLAIASGQPVFYLAWANLNIKAEALYLKHSLLLDQTLWNSGDRLWLLDWVAPFGHTRIMRRLLRNQLFAERYGRYLYHRGDERGLRIKTFYGIAVPPEEARLWFTEHPAANGIQTRSP
jgi:cytolysin-activating lysine-acyltransferase